MSRSGGRGDEVAATAAGLANGDQLRVCVDQGGGEAEADFYFQGGGASGVSFGTDFSHPFIVAGGGGASSAAFGGDAGMPTGQTGGGSGPGTGGDNASHHGGTGGSSSASSVGGDGQAFTAAGPGTGGNGGDRVCCGTYPGGSGGGGYYGGGGAGGGGDGTGGSIPPGGGGGGSSYCGADNVSLSVTGCVRTGGVGTSTDAGAGDGQAKVILTFATGTLCDLGTYSATGSNSPDSCTPADAGHYVDTLGASDTERRAPTGYYQASTAPDSLPSGRRSATTSTRRPHRAQTKCPDGTTTREPASTSSADCVATSSSYQPDAMIRLSGLARIGQNIYSSDGTGETLTLKPH